MAKRTVIRRLVKMLFNTAPTLSSEASTIIASYNRTTEEEYDNAKPSYGGNKNGVANQIDIEELEPTLIDETIPDPIKEESPETTKKEKDLFVGDDGQAKLF